MTRAVLAVVVAYAAGALPFSNWAARRRGGPDLRTVGSGTVSGTSLYRVAGFKPLAVAGVLEIAKGAVGPALAGRDHPALMAVAGGAAVSGHNWSPFLRFAGGRGVSPAIGALLVSAPVGAALLLGGLIGGRLAGETALGCLASYVLLVPVLGAVDGGSGALAGSLIVVPLLAKRVLGNRRPASAAGRGVYLVRLLYDRDQRAKSAAA